MLDHPAAGPASNRFTPCRGTCDLRDFSEISKGQRAVPPAIDAQRGLVRALQERLVDRHIQRGGMRLGIEQLDKICKEHAAP